MTRKIIILSALNFIVAALLLFAVDIGLYYLFYDVIFDLFDKFNSLSLFIKIIILFFGGFTIFMFLTQALGRLTVLIGGLIFDRFPQNAFTKLSTFALSFANAIMCIIWLWTIPEHYNFWVICELITLSLFIWSLCAIVMPAKELEKELSKPKY